MTADLTLLARQVDGEVAAARILLIDMARAAAKESGIRAARTALADAPRTLAEAQAAYRDAQAAEGEAKAALERELVEADWELDVAFEVQGNKTVMVAVRGDNGSWVDLEEAKRRPMTADERKAWKAAEARRMKTAAVERLRQAEMATAAARDALDIASKQLTVRRIDLEAAIAELYALAAVLPRKAE